MEILDKSYGVFLKIHITDYEKSLLIDSINLKLTDNNKALDEAVKNKETIKAQDLTRAYTILMNLRLGLDKI